MSVTPHVTGKINMIKWRIDRAIEEKKKLSAAELSSQYSDINWEMNPNWLSKYELSYFQQPKFTRTCF